MADEKHLYKIREEPPPIPSYEEATSSTQHSRRGPQESSDDAERQTLLGHDLPQASGSSSRRRNGYYHPPSVQSERSSLDEDSGPDRDADGAEDDEETALRDTMEEMEILDPESAEDGDGGARRRRARGRFSKRFYSITNSLSGFHLPRIPWPSFGWGWLKSKMPHIPPEYIPGWAVFARLCGLVLIITLVYMLVVSEVVPLNGGFGAEFNPEWVRQYALSVVDTRRIEQNLRYITSYDHVAGTEGSYVLGQYIEERFQEAHMDSYTHDEFFVYLNYPRAGGRRIAIVEPSDKAWEASLEEENVYHDSPKAQTQTFHGLSASGNVTQALIYANYGHESDFKVLSDSGIDVKDAIVLMRYYGSQSDRSMKVKAAQDAGAAGVIMYSDPADDGFKKGKVWPDGPWRTDDGVQRGSVAMTNMIVGDVLTPGRPSTKDQKRMSKSQNPALPNIPSIPISWKNAQKLLQSLKGAGQKVHDDWVGGVPDVGEWWTGSREKSPKVHLMNQQDEVETQRITNVFGTIVGWEEPNKKIVIGNHRDSWCFGAADPGSGTAVMLEVARVMGELRMQGWRPRRTIEFASWDAEEYNMIGSTEHVEANMEELRANAVAYLNVDSGVTGGKLWANGSPLFKHAWLRVLDRLDDPSQNHTLIDLWKKDHGRIGPLGAASDYVAFQDLAGCSSFDFGFSGPEHADMYHSCYETFEWAAKYIDPHFAYHTLLTKIWVLLILELAQERVLPLKLDDYAYSLQEEVHTLMEWTKSKINDVDHNIFKPLQAALDKLSTKTRAFSEFETAYQNQMVGAGESQGIAMQRMMHNAKIIAFETDLLDLPADQNDNSEHGLPGRTQFKHVIFAPDAWGSGYDAAIFPFIRDAVERRARGQTKDWNETEAMIKKTAGLISRAAEKLFN